MNTLQKSRQAGFTVIELIVAVLILALAGLATFKQLDKLNTSNEDAQRKTAINAMYYALEEVYYKDRGTYPQTLTSAILPSVDPALFTDPDGFTMGKEALSQQELQKLIDSGSTSPDVEKRLAALNADKQPNYHYDATDCDTSGNCKSYTLRADLVGESQYIKKSRKH